MKSTTLNWLMAGAIVVLIGLMQHLDDGIADRHAEWQEAVDLQVAINQAIEQKKFDRAAQALNGEDLKKIMDRSAQRTEA